MTERNQQSSLLGKIAAYTELLVKDPRSTIFVSLAETYRKMGLLEDAKQIILKGLELHSDFSPAHIVLARVYCQLENFDESSAAFERALELDPDSLAALVGYARVKLILGCEDEARDLLLHARGLSPADPVINKLLLSLTPPPVEEAGPIVDEAAAAPSAEGLSSLVSTTLADLYLKQGLTEKGLSLYRQLSLNDPDNLVLRRKIKEIESFFHKEQPLEELETRTDPVATEPPVEVAEPAPALEEELSVDTEISAAADLTLEEDHVDEELDSVLGSDDAVQPLEVLSRWLENLRQRRSHV